MDMFGIRRRRGFVRQDWYPRNDFAVTDLCQIQMLVWMMILHSSTLCSSYRPWYVQVLLVQSDGIRYSAIAREWLTEVEGMEIIH